MNQANETCPAELPNWCAQRHWSIFWILIVVSVAMVAARILSLGEVKDGLPFFSANDRSRWVTVRALVDHGTFEIDRVLASENGSQWDTIDKVRHVGSDGRFRYYSSKPPMLTLAMAGFYQVGKLLIGWEISTDTHFVVRTLLLITNVSFWAIYLWFLARFINSVPVRDWTRYFVLACAGFATFLGIFTISLNNHLPAAMCVMISLYCGSEIVRRSIAGWGYFVGAGFFSALAVANEFPALAFLVGIALVCCWQSLWRTIAAFVPAAIIVFAAMLAGHWFAWGQLLPAYAQRQDGDAIATVSGNFDRDLNQGKLPDSLRDAVSKRIPFSAPMVEPGRWPDTPYDLERWVVRDLDPRSVSQMAITAKRDSGSMQSGLESNELNMESTNSQSTNRQYELREWGNWYDYPGSYWLEDSPKKSGIDRGERSVEKYAFHVLFGHHGIFSLTPIWLLSFGGMLALIGGAKFAGRFSMRWLGMLGLAVSIVVIGFYLWRPAMERNYGGMCCTVRWLLWFSPIWLATMLPVVDWLGASRLGKVFCLGLMFYSALSALYHAANPWTLPWLYDLWQWMKWPM
jgi:hypothetical protein